MLEESLWPVQEVSRDHEVLCVAIVDLFNRIAVEAEERCARKGRMPPSGLNPQHSAIAAGRVDFPLPFSPTKNVTRALKSRSIPRENARTLNG